MNDVVTALCCLLPAALVIAWFLLSRRANQRFGRWTLERNIQATCIRCQGQGWTQQQHRTLDFDGEGFAESHERPVPCPECHGTGRVIR